MKKILGLVSVAFLLSANAFANSDASASVGVGSIKNGEKAIFIEGGKGIQVPSDGDQPFRFYGIRRGAIELGRRNVALHGNMSGAGVADPSAFGPFVDLEFGNLQYSWNSDSARNPNYIEWSPMLSAGVHANLGDICELSALARGGASIGSMNGHVAKSAYGVGSYNRCGPLRVAGEMFRYNGSYSTDLANVDARINVGPASVGMSVTALADRVNTDDLFTTDPAHFGDQRIMFNVGNAR